MYTHNNINWQKILFCLENQEQAAQIGSSARQKVIDFYNWERVAKSTLEVIESVTKGKELLLAPSK